jgi:hypothetical protein
MLMEPRDAGIPPRFAQARTRKKFDYKRDLFLVQHTGIIIVHHVVYDFQVFVRLLLIQ